MELTWGTKEPVGSMVTPRLRARGEGVMVEGSMVSEMGPVFFESGFGAYEEELCFVAVEFEGIEGQPCFYCRDAGF